jgi:general secretion pathway protein E
LRQVASPTRKVITIEEPVEYQLEGINQINVNPKIGLSFAEGLRHILRQDPDVIMVGEIRDHETAEIAIHSALTGHLVLSTLHTNDAAGAVARLLEMGAEPFLVASSLEGVLAQRLVRRICLDCKESYEVPQRMVASLVELDSAAPETFRLYRGRGCERCKRTGYRGRIGIYELLLIDETVKDLILARASSGEIKEAAIRAGMWTLRQDGWNKALEGFTTLEEVERVTHEDERVAANIEDSLKV